MSILFVLKLSVPVSSQYAVKLESDTAVFAVLALQVTPIVILLAREIVCDRLFVHDTQNYVPGCIVLVSITALI